MKTIHKAICALFGKSMAQPLNLRLAKNKFRDAAFGYRMGAGFPGDVNRTHPCDIFPAQILSTNPPTAYGQLVIQDVSGNGVRPLGVADAAPTSVGLYGVTVRPFPVQQAAATNYGQVQFGSVAPPTYGEIDVLKSGPIMVQLSTGAGPIVNGTPAYIWTAATVAGHVQGGWDTANGANTILIPGAYFNGAGDATGVTELLFNL